MDYSQKYSLSNNEKPYYEAIYNSVAKQKENEKYLPYELIPALFKKSKLSKEILADIWKKMEIRQQKISIHQLFIGLKHIAIRQNTTDDSLLTEKPLPEFDDESIKALKSQKELMFLIPTITSTDYIKSGFMGLKSYVVYSIETKAH